MTTDNDVRLVVKAVEERLGDRGAWVKPAGYPHSLAHCIIDSVFSLQARYGSVGNVLERYSESRRSASGDPTKDGGPELKAAIEAAGGAEKAATTLFNNQSKAPGTTRLKAVAVSEGVAALADQGVHTTEDLRRTADDVAWQTEVKRSWLRVKGLGWASWRYLLMLAGVDGTKPDTMIIRFVTAAVGAEKRVSAHRARLAIEGAAASFGVETFRLDHSIWRYQSGRWAGPEGLDAA